MWCSLEMPGRRERTSMAARPMTTFVVGIDESESAAGALRWALAESRAHGARLVVVHAWDWPYVGEFGTFVNERLATENFEDAAAEVLHAMVAAARDPATDDIEVEERVVRASPAQALPRLPPALTC